MCPVMCEEDIVERPAHMRTGACGVLLSVQSAARALALALAALIRILGGPGEQAGEQAGDLRALAARAGGEACRLASH